MNLFRSEEHARNWSGFRAEAEGGLLSLQQATAIFGSPMFRERLDPHFIANLGGLRAATMATIKTITDDHPFWRPA